MLTSSFVIHMEYPKGLVVSSNSIQYDDNYKRNQYIQVMTNSNDFRNYPMVKDTTTSSITDWVIENLENNSTMITSHSTTMAGENDTLPIQGLHIGTMCIVPSSHATIINTNDMIDTTTNNNIDSSTNGSSTINKNMIRLLVGRNGWGTGVHPTTRLCFEWILDQATTIQGNHQQQQEEERIMLDYGCGSGILSIAALHSGIVTKCYGVDVEAEALITAVRNIQLNGYNTIENNDMTSSSFIPLHTREVLPYDIHSPYGVDICVANILIGQLLRPSMIIAITSNIKSGGLLCLSGIRPGDDVISLQKAYGTYIEWIDDEYQELAAIHTEGSLESYGFDCGIWCRLVGRKLHTRSRHDDIVSMSDLAVS